MQAWGEFTTSGRLGRAAFWGRHLVGLPIAMFVCTGAEALLGRPAGLVAALFATLFLVSVWGRRLHDRGHSAWWLLLTLVPVLGALALFVDCGLLGTRLAAARYGSTSDLHADYATV
jgi:uncharacterized membrane protein YhaH (DUF805 family)